MLKSFEGHWEKAKDEAIQELTKVENLVEVRFGKVIGKFRFTEITPQSEEIIGMIKRTARLKKRHLIAERISDRIQLCVEILINRVN